MTTNDLQALIDAEARSIAAFNDHEYLWEECQQSPLPAHRKGRYCEHQVAALARHLVANKHPIQQGRIEAVRLTDEELAAAVREEGRLPLASRDRPIADAATAKALAFQDARHEALVEALREIARRPCITELVGDYDQDNMCGCASCVARDALKREE